MLQTVEAEVDENGEIHLLEPLRVTKKSRVIVTLLENGVSSEPIQKGSKAAILEFLQNHRLPDESRRTAEEIEAGIEEQRNSWD